MRVVLTYADYVALPNDGKRYEIHDGELLVTPAPSAGHQRIVRELLVALHLHITAHGLGEVLAAPFDVILAETSVVQPDLLFVANEHSAIITARGAEGPPTLAIEVVSASSRHTDRGAKLQLYGRYGLPWYWIVDPDARVIEVHRLEAGAYRAAERFGGDTLRDLPPFPGLTLDATTLWR